MTKQNLPLKIGLDFDNTIVCYNNAIRLLADKLLDLPTKISRSKLEIRNFLRRAGRENEWTAFQGELYGPGMCYAEPFENSIKKMLELQEADHELIIISHRSQRPYAGPGYDLHAAANDWIENRLKKVGLFNQPQHKNPVNFLETQTEKIRMINRFNCDAFVDDLPEIFCNQSFPARTRSILFAPENTKQPTHPDFLITNWAELDGVIAQL
jgi:hypothetical protein